MTPFGRRILILSPHPDDEVVGVSAAITRAKAAGAEVHVLFLSHGCLGPDVVWPWERAAYEENVARRMLEAQLAAEFLGHSVCEVNMPDGHMLRPARAIWKNLVAVWGEVQAAIASLAPDSIWVPAYEGGNPDHDGLNALASRINNVPVFEFCEYHFAGGREHIGEFIAPRGDETVLALSDEERAQKKLALALYASEEGNLKYFGRMGQESLRPLVPYDYKNPPHAGMLWYARYQWVPFRHPRVDFTKPSEVSAAIAAFFSNLS